MGFKDIQAWRDAMDAEERELQAYDRACAAAERRARLAAQEEYDELDQAQVDPETCACPGDDGCVCLDDLEDDDIDFSVYGVMDEADLGMGRADDLYPTARDVAREPLVRLPAAIGRPASDADLAAQNAVSLMAEAFRKALDKPVDEAEYGEEKRTGERDGVFGEDMAKCLNDMDEKTFAGATVSIDFVSQPGASKSLPGRLASRRGPAKVVGFSSGTLFLDFDGRRQNVGVGEFIRQLKAASVQRMRDIRKVALQPDAGAKYDGFYQFGEFQSINICFLDDDNGLKKDYADFLSEREQGGDLIDNLIDVVKPKTLTEEDKKEDAGGERGEDALEKMAADDDYPLSDADWDEVMELPTFGQRVDLIRQKVGDRWDSLSPKTRERIQREIVDLRVELLKSQWGKRQFQKALRLQQISRNRELTKDEYQEFANIVRWNLDDAQRAALEKNLTANGYAISRRGRTTVVPAAGDRSEGGSGIEDRHDLENLGVDAVYDPEKALAVPEQSEPGTRIPADFNPEYGPEDTAPKTRLQKDIDDLDSRLAKSGQAEREREWRRGEIEDALDSGALDLDTFYTNFPKEWMKIYKALTPDEIKELKRELAAELPGGQNTANMLMLDYMFGRDASENRGGAKAPLDLEQSDLQKAWGYGGDQQGKTGGLTQMTDSIINSILMAFSEYLNICQTERENLAKVARGQNQKTREKAKVARRAIFKEICAELGVDPSSKALQDEFGCVADYHGDRTHRREKAAADKIVFRLFAREFGHMSQAEKDRVKEYLSAYHNKCLDDPDAIVKFESGLNPQQNAEFQQLITDMREDGDLPDDKRLRLLQLDYIRKHIGCGEQEALDAARSQYDAIMSGPHPEQEFVELTTRLAKKFVRGNSKATKDTISVPIVRNRGED